MEFLSDKIRFYELDNDYVKYLHMSDSQVYFHDSYSKDIKPYVGIIATINDIRYFIPLTSPKMKHTKRKLRTKDYMTIYEEVDKTANEKNAVYKDNPNSTSRKYHILGVLEIRKMLPVPRRKYSLIDFSKLNLNYKFLFYKEHSFCKSNQDIIISNAEKIYNQTLAKGAALSTFHCDFIKLEEKMKEYVLYKTNK